MNLDEMPKRPANWNQVSTCTYTTLTYGQPMQQLAYHRVVTGQCKSRSSATGRNLRACILEKLNVDLDFSRQ
jgi:hypothetical protein